jgi:hypothetical protein
LKRQPDTVNTALPGRPTYNRKTRSMHVRPLQLVGQLCYLCGRAVATTYDHVPPRSFFPKQASVKGYKLPTCAACNNSWSKDDEYVRDYLSIAGWNSDAHRVFREGTRESYKKLHNRLLKVTKLERIIGDISSVELKTQSGLHLGDALSIRIDLKRVERLIVRIVKGLHFQYYGIPLPSTCKFEFIFQPNSQSISLLAEIIGSETDGIEKFIGSFGDVFSYGGFVDNTDNVTGTWWLSLFATFGAIVIVEL